MEIRHKGAMTRREIASMSLFSHCHMVFRKMSVVWTLFHSLWKWPKLQKNHGNYGQGATITTIVSASNWIALQFITWSLVARIHAENGRSCFEYRHLFRLLSRVVLSRDFWVR